LSEFGKSPYNIWVSPKVRTSIGKEDYLKVTQDDNGHSKWYKEKKKLKSVGDYETRYTPWYFNV
jgi:hypothetical protein